MARGKHSTALFEVIHSANKPDRIAQILRTPKWWFKSRHSSPQTSLEPEPASQETPASSPPQPAPRPASMYGGRSSAVHFDFDRNRKEITLRLRYTTAVMTGFAVCALIGMSYVIGRHLGRGPQSATAAEPLSTQQLMQQPAQPGVLSVSKPRSAQVATPELRVPLPNNASTPRQAATSALVPSSANTESPRKPHLNYAIIGIFPIDQQAKADAAREHFASHGIPCTLERTGWTNGDWVCLVGTAGFTSSSSPDWNKYTTNIVKVGQGMKSSFDRQQPAAYGWRGPPTDQGL